MRHVHIVLCAACLAILGACNGSDDGGSCKWGGCDSTEYTCGAGTHLEGDTCVSDGGITCGSGTWADGTVCRPLSTGPQITCGAGTHLEGTTCVRDTTTTISCGAGTHLEGSSCVADPSMTCGYGTHLDGSQCVADELVVCGEGTHPDLGRCVQDASSVFELRIATSRINADGYSKVPVLALGRNADGTASAADVILWVSRPGAGTFTPTLFRLGAMGTTSYFVPCSHANAGCVGPVEIRLSLASAPDEIVATTGPLELVAPEGVGTPAPCLVGGNALFFDGSGWVFTGTQLVTAGTFSSSQSASDYVRLWIEPSDPDQGLWWHVDLSSQQLGQPLTTQVYEDAYRAAFAPPSRPGMDIGGDGRGCNRIAGRFQIHEIEWDGSLSRFTATFEQFCEESPSNVLRGCVHYEQ